ncbi:MAG: methyltransferase domain-containing protein [Candidatus Nomurabacteria bacterium]|nr:methyltransferase domain-containing protein [Candidatus Nomurabacteria bacterium]
MFANPESNIAQFNLREGMRVADFGAGSGGYTRSISNHVGHTGHVYAIDIQNTLFRKLAEDTRFYAVKNVECILGDIEKKGGSKLADKSMDAVVVSNVLFQSEDKIGLIDEVKRVLKPKGRVLVIDWMDSFAGMGPQPKYIVPKIKAEHLFVDRGFKIQENISAGSHHYGIIFIYE